MKKQYLAILVLLLSITSAFPASAAYPRHTLGRILIETEKKGEAWYVYPENGLRYFLGRPADAFAVMRGLGLGARNDLIATTNIFPDKLKGRILLDVEQNGEAYYINPADAKKYYLGRPADAFALMRRFGLGIKSADIAQIPAGSLAAGIAPMPASLRRELGQLIDYPVPFLSQAPFGDWADERQQDGCEEASAIMAVAWARGKTAISKEDGLKEILALSDYELEKYGEYRDVALEDALPWIYQDYLGFAGARSQTIKSADEIIEALYAGNILAIPMDGQKLGNPNFTAPGPERHMLVVRGYDPQKDEFITNDPGTRRGEAYRYKRELFYAAIRAYPTGYHEKIERIEKKMIMIKPI